MEELPLIGDPPKHLSARQKKIWQELRLSAVPGVLRISDSVFLEITVRLLDQYRHNPDCKIGIVKELTKCLNQMGFGAMDRLKMGITPEPKRSSPFAYNRNKVDDDPDF